MYAKHRISENLVPYFSHPHHHRLTVDPIPYAIFTTNQKKPSSVWRGAKQRLRARLEANTPITETVHILLLLLLCWWCGTIHDCCASAKNNQHFWNLSLYTNLDNPVCRNAMKSLSELQRPLQLLFSHLASPTQNLKSAFNLLNSRSISFSIFSISLRVDFCISAESRLHSLIFSSLDKLRMNLTKAGSPL